jgi:hypothetical protein
MNTSTTKNTEKYYWTDHVRYKMKYYQLSAQKVLGVIRSPKRKEEGIVENTIAVMQPVSPKMIKNKVVWKQEIWAMYQKKIKNQKSKCINIKKFSHNQIKIISAWRYPGISPKKNPIPNEIINDLKGYLN